MNIEVAILMKVEKEKVQPSTISHLKVALGKVWCGKEPDNVFTQFRGLFLKSRLGSIHFSPGSWKIAMLHV